MKTIKTSELKGAALDWAVAKCEGLAIHKDAVLNGVIKRGVWLSGLNIDPNNWTQLAMFNPSTDWSQGGPIIEREDISFRKYHRPDSEAHGKYYARVCRESGTMVSWHKTTGHQMTGPSPLIAAMRCYVASKLGDAVEVPEELLK